MGFVEAEIAQIVSFLEKEEKKYAAIIAAAPPGYLRVERKGRGGSVKFVHAIKADEISRCIEGAKAGDALYENVLSYQRLRETGLPSSGFYRLGVTNMPDIVKALACKEYATHALEMIRHNLHVLKGAQKRVKDYSFETIRACMKNAYRLLADDYYSRVSLPLSTDEGSKTRMMERYEKWALQPYRQSDYKTEQKKFRTSRNLLVRTKAELIIAEKLYSYEIPFRYEQVLVFGKYELAPDFTFPEKGGDEFYFEYCGMMDDPDYVNHFLWKRSTYESNGLNEWNGKMIYTFNKNNEMDIQEIDTVIREKILPRL